MQCSCQARLRCEAPQFAAFIGIHTGLEPKDGTTGGGSPIPGSSTGSASGRANNFRLRARKTGVVRARGLLKASSLMGGFLIR